MQLSSKFEQADYSEYKLMLPVKNDVGRLNRDSWSVFDTALLNSAKYPFFGPTSDSLRDEFKVLK